MNTQNRRPGGLGAAAKVELPDPSVPAWLAAVTCYSAYRAPTRHPVGVPFIWDGSGCVCPLCHRFLSTGRSRAVRLAEGVPVQVMEREGHYLSAITGGAFYANARRCPPNPSRPRWYAHEDCARRWLLLGGAA